LRSYQKKKKKRTEALLKRHYKLKSKSTRKNRDAIKQNADQTNKKQTKSRHRIKHSTMSGKAGREATEQMPLFRECTPHCS
jgi:hypothetical protein